MYKLSCKDIGGFMECDHVALGDSPEEAEAKLMEHGRAVHGEALDAMSPEQLKAIDDKIKQRLNEQQGA